MGSVTQFPFHVLKIIRITRQVDGTPRDAFFSEGTKDRKPVEDAQLWYLFDTEVDDGMVPIYRGPDGLDFANANPPGFNGTLLGYAYRNKPDTAVAKALRPIISPTRRIPDRTYPLEELRVQHGNEFLGFAFPRPGTDGTITRESLHTFNYTEPNGNTHIIITNNAAGATIWSWQVTISEVVTNQHITVHADHFGYGWQETLFFNDEDDTDDSTGANNPNIQGGEQNAPLDGSLWDTFPPDPGPLSFEFFGNSDTAHGSPSAQDGTVQTDTDGRPILCGSGIPLDWVAGTYGRSVWKDKGGDRYRPVIWPTLEFGHELTLGFKGQNHIHRYRSIVTFPHAWNVGIANSSLHPPIFISNFIYDQLWAYDVGSGTAPDNLQGKELAFGALPTITYTEPGLDHHCRGPNIAVQSHGNYIGKSPFASEKVAIIGRSSDGGTAETAGWGPGNDFCTAIYFSDFWQSGAFPGGKNGDGRRIGWHLNQFNPVSSGVTGADSYTFQSFIEFAVGATVPGGELIYDTFVIIAAYDDVITAIDWLFANGY